MYQKMCLSLWVMTTGVLAPNPLQILNTSCSFCNCVYPLIIMLAICTDLEKPSEGIKIWIWPTNSDSSLSPFWVCTWEKHSRGRQSTPRETNRVDQMLDNITWQSVLFLWIISFLLDFLKNFYYHPQKNHAQILVYCKCSKHLSFYFHCHDYHYYQYIRTLGLLV